MAPSTLGDADTPLRQHLAERERSFDPACNLLSLPLASPGYHTTLTAGPVHPTRDSLQYALALIDSGTRDDLLRAADVIDAVLALQDTDPLSPTFGVWPWFLEEPLARMSPPDFNWADFLGAMLAQALIQHPQRLPHDLASRMRDALRRAALAIFRRNVTVAYTNIAFMGAAVTAMAGEVLDRPELLDYGRAKLQAILRHVDETGGFAEYNSPTYSLVAVTELDRVLHFVRDAETRAAAATLHARVWTMIAEHFHAPTHQWAGPHARAYHDRLTGDYAAHLAAATGASVHVRVQRDDGAFLDPPPRRWFTVPPRPCPPELAHHFTATPSEPHAIRRTFGRDAAGEIVGVTWFSPDACLGSVNRAGYWTQHRTLLGYWCTRRDPAVTFRTRFLKDGRDFASMGVRQAQAGPRVLAAVFPLAHAGDYHITLDRPADGRFHARDLRWRFELQGVDAAVERADDATFLLRSGEHRVVIHALPGTWDGQPVRWQAGGDAANDTVWVEALCLSTDAPHAFIPAELRLRLAAGIELLRNDESPAPPPTATPGTVAWSAAQLSVPLAT